MKRRLATLALLLALAAAGAAAQVIIDLKPGGGLRAKTADDYAAERQTARRAQADSTAWTDCVRRALNALATDSLDEARTLFEKALALRPDAPAGHIVHDNLGRIAMARGQWAEAEKRLTQALRAAPGYKPARLARATARLEDGRPREALEDAEALERLAPDSAERRQILFIRLGAHMQQRLYGQACRDARNLLALDPDDRSAALMLVMACEGDGRTTEALERANLFVQRYPESVDGLALRASLLQKADQPDAALDDLDRAVRLAPADATLRTARAETLIRLGRHAAARAELDQAVRLGIPRAHLNTLYKRTRH